METYSYECIDGITRWGYRIFTDDTKTQLAYESAGFATEAKALADMKVTLTDWDNF